MKSNRAEYAVSMMCQVLGVSPSGYYAWVGRKPSARSLADAALTARIKKIHEESRATYGVPRISI